MKIILTRHGETKETKAGILQWHIPWKLTSHGIEQAKKLASKLKDENIDIIFSSDLARSYDTAEEIHKRHPNTPIKSNKLLRERSFGDLEGKNKQDIGFYDKEQQCFFDSPKNWETMEKVYNRAKNFWEGIFPKYIDKTILVVSHDDIWKALVAVITWKNHQYIINIPSMGKATITIFEVNKNKEFNKIIYWDTQHLN